MKHLGLSAETQQGHLFEVFFLVDREKSSRGGNESLALQVSFFLIKPHTSLSLPSPLPYLLPPALLTMHSEQPDGAASQFCFAAADDLPD